MRQPDRGHEESALGVFLVSDGVDRCLIGFLPRQLIRDSGGATGGLQGG